MATTANRGSDFAAALGGLVGGASILFLLMLLIVWLTNRHFEGRESHAAPASAHAPITGPAASTPEGASPAPAGTTPPAASPPANITPPATGAGSHIPEPKK